MTEAATNPMDKLEQDASDREEALGTIDNDDLPAALVPQLEKLKAQYGDLFIIRQPAVPTYGQSEQPPDDVIVVKRPSQPDVEILMSKLLGSSAIEKSKAILALTKKVRVWPDDAAFKAMIGRRHGLLVSFSNKVQEIAGIAEGTELAKL